MSCGCKETEMDEFINSVLLCSEGPRTTCMLQLEAKMGQSVLRHRALHLPELLDDSLE